MPAQQIFYVIYVTDPAIGPILSAIRLLWNPGAKWLPHITVRGPYPEPQEIERADQQIRGKTIEVVGSGRFRRPDQDVVHLEVETDLSAVWDLDHNNPHITVARAPRGWSRRLVELLSPTRFSFRAEGLSELVSGSPGNLQPSEPFSSPAVRSILRRNLSLSEVKELDLGERLGLIGHLALHLRR